MYVQSFRELIVWQKSIELVDEIYELVANLPQNENYGLKSQMQRAAVSIPSNIAEGKKRGTKKDFIQFLRIADGSAAELETQLIITKRRYKVESKKAESLLNEVEKMLNAMIRSLLSYKLPAKS